MAPPLFLKSNQVLVKDEKLVARTVNNVLNGLHYRPHHARYGLRPIDIVYHLKQLLHFLVVKLVGCLHRALDTLLLLRLAVPKPILIARFIELRIVLGSLFFGDTVRLFPF